MSEYSFVGQILDLAHIYRWRIVHFTPARVGQDGAWRTPYAGDKGFPDLILVRDGRLIIAECKSKRGRLRPDQIVWLEALSSVAGIEVYTWREGEIESIKEVLR